MVGEDDNLLARADFRDVCDCWLDLALADGVTNSGKAFKRCIAEQMRMLDDLGGESLFGFCVFSEISRINRDAGDRPRFLGEGQHFMLHPPQHDFFSVESLM